jgi:hypothetical protein
MFSDNGAILKFHMCCVLCVVYALAGYNRLLNSELLKQSDFFEAIITDTEKSLVETIAVLRHENIGLSALRDQFVQENAALEQTRRSIEKQSHQLQSKLQKCQQDNTFHRCELITPSLS